MPSCNENCHQSYPISFTIPCTIGNSIFEKALCDLGTSINLMSLSIFRRLGLGEAHPTIVTLQLADRSLKHPRGRDRRHSSQSGEVHIFGRFHCSRYGRR